MGLILLPSIANLHVQIHRNNRYFNTGTKLLPLYSNTCLPRFLLSDWCTCIYHCFFSCSSASLALWKASAKLSTEGTTFFSPQRCRPNTQKPRFKTSLESVSISDPQQCMLSSKVSNSWAQLFANYSASFYYLTNLAKRSAFPWTGTTATCRLKFTQLFCSAREV